MNVAGMPRSVNESTWSFINAISGEMTIVTPSRAMVGNWKHKLLPPPGGHNAQCVATGQNRFDHMLLAGAKAIEPEVAKPLFRLDFIFGHGQTVGR